MKGIYLGAYLAQHDNYSIVYQDINGKRDLPGDMMEINLQNYDFVIATPPCNYYSRANWRRNESAYSLNTRLLLPAILFKLCLLNKPFIVENVRNSKAFDKLGLFDLPGCHYFVLGRHTYWTNVWFDTSDIVQKPKVEIRDGKRIWLSSQNLPGSKRQGTEEVHEVVERFLKAVYERQSLFGIY